MTPQRFAGANVVMQRPAGMTEEQCADIHAFRDGERCIVAFRPTAEDLVRINLGEPIWLHIMGASMPPVALSTEDPFVFVPPAPTES